MSSGGVVVTPVAFKVKRISKVWPVVPAARVRVVFPAVSANGLLGIVVHDPPRVVLYSTPIVRPAAPRLPVSKSTLANVLERWGNPASKTAVVACTSESLEYPPPAYMGNKGMEYGASPPVSVIPM